MPALPLTQATARTLYLSNTSARFLQRTITRQCDKLPVAFISPSGCSTVQWSAGDESKKGQLRLGAKAHGRTPGARASADVDAHAAALRHPGHVGRMHE